ncbi:Alpha/Beta hydrolase protein [Lipomyces arxii]|uniref:Alpha/Beta hydrolase protein n=1 Tax=Lipomyces arxii TaxID=56418 RepID=UPI0034CF9A8D
MSMVFTHKQLGEMEGVELCEGRVVQFRAIQFATIPGRFRQSQLCTKLLKHDFREYGAVCPQPPMMEGTGTVFGARVSDSPMKPKQDEYECLNLTVTVPFKALSSDESVPVLVYIHGGGFLFGGANSEFENTAKLVDLSDSIGKPIICVAIQYRMNYFGFAYSKELIDYATKLDEPAGNYGIRDVLTAFNWIRKFIDGFGGDARKVTACGESAGAVVISSIICADNLPMERPFSRAILQSGIASTSGARPLECHQEIFDNAAKRFLRTGFSQDKLTVMQEYPANDIFKLEGNPDEFDLAIDNILFDSPLTTSEVCKRMQECQWVDAFLAGDNKDEGALFADMISGYDTNTGFLNHHLFVGFGAESVSRIPNILATAGVEFVPLTGKVSDREEQVLITLLAGVMFHAPVYALMHCSTNIKGYYYHFDRVNNFANNGLHGTSHHALELLYLFQHISFQPDVELRADEVAAQESLGKTWIEFVHGLEPWAHDMVGVLDKNHFEILTEREDIERHGRQVQVWKVIASL